MSRDTYLLPNETARHLYFDMAENLPVIDYHNHLTMRLIAENTHFSDMTALWIAPDPYKHRLMRICGVPEAYITGGAAPYETFWKWCEIFPRLIGTPVYDWSVRELRAIFGIAETPCRDNAASLWAQTNEMLASDEYTPQGILHRFNIEYAAPCASVTDDLSPFAASDTFAPSLRGDDLTHPTAAFIRTVEEKTSAEISTLDGYITALAVLLDRFVSVGCRFADHALDDGFHCYPDDGKNEYRYTKTCSGEPLDAPDADALASEILRRMMGEYAKRHMTVQLHIGAARHTSTRLRKIAGAAGGYAGIGGDIDVQSIIRLLDGAEKGAYGLPRTVLFTLNPAYNAAFAALSGSFSSDGVRSVVSCGPAWWWCDHKSGMESAFEDMASFSVLSEFIGMTTDSRSLLSFVRHDYFRRVFCGWLGEKVEKGIYPHDEAALFDLTKRVCYENAHDILING